MVETAKRQGPQEGKAHGLVFALRELALVLADWWQAGDLGGRLRAWFEVVTGQTPIE